MTDGAGVPLAPGVAGLESETRLSVEATGAAAGVESGDSLASLMGVSSLLLGWMMARRRAGETLRRMIFVGLAAGDLRRLSLAEAAPLALEGGMASMCGWW